MKKKIITPLLQKTGWTAKALLASLLFLHWFEQCWQTSERGQIQQYGAAQYTHCLQDQLYFLKPHTQATTYHSEDTLTANPEHGEQTFFHAMWCLFQDLCVALTLSFVLVHNIK